MKQRGSARSFLRRSWFAAALPLALSGCAAVWKAPTDQAVFFDSTPLGEPVAVDGAKECVTMCTRHLLRKTSHQVAISRSGLPDTTIAISRHAIAKWVVLDLTFGVGIGLLFDAKSGRLFELAPANIDISPHHR